MRTDTISAITAHPKATLLQAQIYLLKDRLGAVLEQISLLKYRAKDVLVALYTERIGTVEYQLLCTQIDVRSLRRRIELVTAHLNRGADITDDILGEIEADIDAEMKEWRAKARQQEERIRVSAAILGNLTELDRETHGRIKSSYRKLCRMLHPDIIGEETDLYRRYWQEVQDAYAVCNGDLLESLLSVVEARSNDIPSGDGIPFGELTKEVSRLERLIEKQADDLVAMRTKPPFCYDTLLQDVDWVRDRQQSLKASIAATHEECCRLKTVLEFLILTKPGRLH
jgi:hypothetical protein